MALIRIYVTLERQTENGTEHETHADMTRDTIDAGLIADLENFWRVVRKVAAIRNWTPTMHVCSDDRSHSVALRDPPFKPIERAQATRAETIYEALCKLTDATHATRAASERASARVNAAHVSQGHASGTHARARASEHPRASDDRASGAHPRASEHASAERASMVPPSDAPARGTRH